MILWPFALQRVRYFRFLGFFSLFFIFFSNLMLFCFFMTTVITRWIVQKVRNYKNAGSLSLLFERNVWFAHCENISTFNWVFFTFLDNYFQWYFALSFSNLLVLLINRFALGFTRQKSCDIVFREVLWMSFESKFVLFIWGGFILVLVLIL